MSLHRFSLRCVPLLACAFLAHPSSSARGAAPPAPLPAVVLAARQREAVDARARARPVREPARDRARILANVPAWLLTRLELPPADERARCARVHEAIRAAERVETAPDPVERLFRALLREVPPLLDAHGGAWRLHVLGGPAGLFTPGAGQVYLRRPLLDACRAGARGEAALAFLLARQIGHVALGHCRRGWQRLEIEDELRRGLDRRVLDDDFREGLHTGVRRVGELVSFYYTPAQEDEADLFALHLCRNAGLDVDASLDALRWQSLLVDEEDPLVPANTPAPLDRLRRLLDELGGRVSGDEFGLFSYDRERETLIRCPDGSVRPGDRPVVLVHGMHGDANSLVAHVHYLGQRRELLCRPLLVFAYPGNGSLARSGLFLGNELRRVGAERAGLRPGEGPSFVCHSAGGLVFRYHAERGGGAFERAILLVTPHAGSNLTELKFLADLGEFAGGLGAGLGETLNRTAASGWGELTLDLQPGSLFLRHLGRDAGLAARYHVFTGQYLGLLAATAARAGFASGKARLDAHLGELLSPPWLNRARARVRALHLPEEVLRGDLIVSRASAHLPGAGRLTELALPHQAFRTDPVVLRAVLQSLVGPGVRGK